MADAIFNEDFISNLPDDDSEAWYIICQECIPIIQRYSENKKPIESLVDVHCFIETMEQIRPIGIELTKLNLEAPKRYASIFINKLVQIKNTTNDRIKTKKLKESYYQKRDYYSAIIPGGFSYEFLETDYKRIQELIDEIRTLTSESKEIDAGHKRRLLKKLERLQQELHKKMSDLDTFWGLLPVAGLSLGKFGENVKPLTDRICEILRIVTRTQARAEGLPPAKDIPLLKGLDCTSEDPDNKQS